MFTVTETDRTKAAMTRRHPRAAKELVKAMRDILPELQKIAEERAKDIGAEAFRLMLLELEPETGKAWIQVIMTSMLKRAADGDVKAAALVFERAYGKAGTTDVGNQVQKIALLVQQLAPLDAPRAPAAAPAPTLDLSSAAQLLETRLVNRQEAPIPDRPAGVNEPRRPQAQSETEIPSGA